MLQWMSIGICDGVAGGDRIKCTTAGVPTAGPAGRRHVLDFASSHAACRATPRRRLTSLVSFDTIILPKLCADHYCAPKENYTNLQ
jgi:hypothetical protein